MGITRVGVGERAVHGKATVCFKHGRAKDGRAKDGLAGGLERIGHFAHRHTGAFITWYVQ